MKPKNIYDDLKIRRLWVRGPCSLFPKRGDHNAKQDWKKKTHENKEQGNTQYEPSDEIMALFILRKLIFQTRMRSHPVGLDDWFLVGLFVYFHTSCLRTAKALARLRGCAGSAEPSLVAYVIYTIISWAGSYETPRGKNHKCTHK